MSFLCDVDLGNRQLPSTWPEALAMLKESYANSTVIAALAEVLHQKILIITVHGVGKCWYMFKPFKTAT